MSGLECPGLPASWLNAWLAAVGTTVLVPDMRLSWTDGPEPHAVLSVSDDSDPVHALVSAWPSRERVAEMPISKARIGCAVLGRQPLLSAFVERAHIARSHHDGWTLSSTLTDLYCTDSTEARAAVKHSKLDPSGPGTIGTLHDRLLKVMSHLEGDAAVAIRSTFAGRGRRVGDNGLGFDARRITALADGSKPRTDPAIETLAFFGLALLPMRGDGVAADRRGAIERYALRQRGWHLVDANRPRRLHWPAWSPRLGRFGIDALLDAWRPRDRRNWNRLGVHSGWISVEYTPRGSADTTRGIGSAAL